MKLFVGNLFLDLPTGAKWFRYTVSIHHNSPSLSGLVGTPWKVLVEIRLFLSF